MNRHSESDIEEFVNRYVINPFNSSGILMFLGFLFTFISSLLLIIFYSAGLIEDLSSPNGASISFGAMLILGLFFIFRGFISRNKLKSSLKNQTNPRANMYKQILNHGRIIESKIDDTSINYGFRVNGMPQTTFYLNLGSEKVQFSTFNPNLVTMAQYEKSMYVYYDSQFPDIIIPYDLVSSSSKDQLALKSEYRKISIV